MEEWEYLIMSAKFSDEKIEDLNLATHELPELHREYLWQRHGTLDLDPIPSMDPADPYNWPGWKKVANLCLVAFHACMGTLTAAAIICAYEEISQDLEVSLQRVSYLTSLQIAILGVAPLFWETAVASRRGVGNVGCAVSHSYAAMAACRALVAFFISPAMALGSAVVTETFFQRERARYMGIWTVMVTLGVPVGPFLFGFVAQRVGYRWIYWVLALTNAGEFLLYLVFGPETRYVGDETDTGSSFQRQYLSIRRIDRTPLTVSEFVHPLTLVRYPSVLLSAIAYAMVFVFASVMNSVEVPQLLQQKFGLDVQQLGLQFLGLIIGSLLGEQLGGILSDVWMNVRARRIGHPPAPEYRLWLSYVGFLVTIAGMVVFLVCTEQATQGHWTVTPVVGTGIAAFGNQVVTTVLTTYAVDTHAQDSGSVGVFINLVRSTWGFLGPFWFPDLFDAVGIANSSGVVTALIVGVGICPTVWLHWRYYSPRSRLESD
ncbi:uncharacterized protein ATNIH1004_000070 [Aspergillus tanneri]|uniref:Major facilitator superfamily (MFS) profile domain-containing protein n=1 Tax=Aspergillus tanneri TaxID=1220188 RepID=A0A5M9MVN2_9EURO|nr:uncharacterized protein ATNIH1004_000070 [Aspergillus tanneri]KAA8651192.1 hypothetical protein ATNIH1004_000070 [Aspergillus tanneri]